MGIEVTSSLTELLNIFLDFKMRLRAARDWKRRPRGFRSTLPRECIFLFLEYSCQCVCGFQVSSLRHSASQCLARFLSSRICLSVPGIGLEKHNFRQSVLDLNHQPLPVKSVQFTCSWSHLQDFRRLCTLHGAGVFFIQGAKHLKLLVVVVVCISVCEGLTLCSLLWQRPPTPGEEVLSLNPAST